MKLSKYQSIKTLSGQTTRPTSAKVRQALFNIWQGQINQTSWLDLCAGTGAVGALALAEGARSVVGIEINRHACQIIEENWQKVTTEEQKFQIIQGDVLTRLKTLTEQQFDFIYFDPPYQSNLYESVLGLIAVQRLLSPTGELAVEHNPKFWQPSQVISELEISRIKRYGDTFLSFFRVPAARLENVSG